MAANFFKFSGSEDMKPNSKLAWPSKKFDFASNSAILTIRDFKSVGMLFMSLFSILYLLFIHNGGAERLRHRAQVAGLMPMRSGSLQRWAGTSHIFFPFYSTRPSPAFSRAVIGVGWEALLAGLILPQHLPRQAPRS